MAKYLVTGGAGFIGSHLVDGLIDKGHSVTVLDNMSRGKISNVNLNARIVTGDILNPTLVEQLVKHSDGVFHLAALARVRPSIEDPLTYNLTNVNGTLNILESARKYDKKVVFASSSSVFGDQPQPFHEQTPKNPLNPYALQKLIAEQYIELYGKLYNLDYSIVRYFNVYGERQLTDGAYACVIGIFERQAKAGEYLTIFGDGEQKRDFTYVKEAVEATILCLQPQANQQTFNIGRGANRSVKFIADQISEKQVFLDPIVGEMAETLCDNYKAGQVLGWFPKVNVEDWINGSRAKT